MKSDFLNTMLLLLVLGLVLTAQADANEYQGVFGGPKGEWQVQLKGPGSSGQDVFNICIKENGEWNILKHYVHWNWKGKYHSQGMPVYLYAINGAGSETLTFSLMFTNRTGKRMSGAYMRTFADQSVKFSDNAVLTYKKPICSPYNAH